MIARIMRFFYGELSSRAMRRPATFLTPDCLILFWRHSSTREHDLGFSWLSSTGGRRR
jgi:hypothetical protein